MRRDALWAGGLFLLALGVRLWRIGEESLWVDEAFTWNVSDLPFMAIAALPEQTPPLYNLMMHAWTTLAGTSEFALRLPSAIMGAATVPLLYFLGCRVAGQRAGAVAALLLAASFLHLRWSQTARTYALFTFVSVASHLTLVRIMDRPAPRGLAAYVLATSCMLYAHAFGVFLLAGQTLFLALHAGRNRRPLFLAQSLALVVWIPWVPVLLARSAAVGASFWIPQVSLDGLRHLGSGAASYGGFAFRGAVVGTVVTACAYLVRHVSQGGARLAARGLSVLVCWVGVPFVAALVLSLAWRPLVVPAYFLPLWPAAYLAVAWGLALVPSPTLSLGATSLLVGAFVVNAGLGIATPQNQDWRGVASILDRDARPGEVVLFDEPYCGLPPARQCALDYYLQRSDLRFVPVGRTYLGAAGNPAPVDPSIPAWVVLADASHPEGVAAALGSGRPTTVDLQFNKIHLQRYGPAA